MFCSLRCLLHLWMWCCPLLFSRENRSGVPSPAALLMACIRFLQQGWGPGLFLSALSGGYIQWVLRPKRVSKAKYYCFRIVPTLMFLVLQLFFFLSREISKNSRARVSFLRSSPPRSGVTKLERPFFACKPHHVVLPTGGGEITAWI